ncbi:MAG: TonB-dependent receptor plug domain-containing protein, partial [bacterium]|nr:TonB-dependent receptor plug domain-containing protein [bacterium]
MRNQRQQKSLLNLVIIIVMILSSWAYPQDQKKIKKYFKMDLYELMGIEMTTAGKKKEKVSDIPASVVLITREDIEMYGYQSLAEILENVPGLYMINHRAVWGEAFGIRGYWAGWPQNIIFLVNGVDQNDGIGFYRLENISLPVEAIDRIEVVRGPMSVIYGNGAFFGAINIVTNEVSKKEAVSLVSASLGSEEIKRAAVRVSGQEGKLTYSFNAGYYDTYGPDEPLSKMVSDISTLAGFGISEANNNTATGGRLEFESTYFNLSGTYKGFFADVSYNQSTREEYHFWPAFSDGFNHRDHFATASFGYEGKLSDKLTLKGTVKYYDSGIWREFDAFTPNFYGTQETNTSKYEFELNAFFKPTDDFDLLVGLNYKNEEAKSNLNVPVFSLHTAYYASGIETFSFFTQGNYTLSEKLQLVAGVRMEKVPSYTMEYWDNALNVGLGSTVVTGDFEVKKAEVAPRFALIYSFNKHHIIKLLYGKAVKFSTWLNNLEHQLVSGFDPIEPERINTFEINYLGTFSSKFSANISLFRNNLTNLAAKILRFDDEGNWAPYTTNAGKIVSNGVELLIYAKPFENSFLELGGTWQKSKDKRPGYEGRDVEYSPNFLGYIKASYR